MKLHVIVSEYGAAANIGGNVETRARTFDLPPEAADYIRANKGKWQSVCLAFEDETAQEQGGSDANGNR